MYYFSCPSCTNNTRFYRVRGQSRPRYVTIVSLDYLVSWLFLSFEYRPHVQCAHCGYIFFRPAMAISPMAKGAMLILLCGLVAVFAGVLMASSPETFAALPGWGYVMLLDEVIAEHSTATAAGIVAGLSSTVLLAFFIAAISNWRHHREIKAEYEYRPSEFPPQLLPPITVESPPQQCPVCEYDLTGNVSGVCPECGKAITANRGDRDRIAGMSPSDTPHDTPHGHL